MKIFRLCIFLALSITAYICSAGRISYTQSMRMSMVEMKSIYADTLTNIGIDAEYDKYDSFSSSIDGAPGVPMKYVYFVVPSDAYDFSISVKPTFTESKKLQSQVIPVQNNLASSPRHDLYFDKSIYSVDKFYPETYASIDGDGYLGGNRIITVAISPIAYNPVSKILKTTSFILHLDFKTGKSESGTVSMQPIEPTNAERYKFDLDLTKSIVANPMSVTELRLSGEKFSSNVASPLPVYDYCIITDRNLRPAFDRLVAWKQQKGYNAGVVCIEDILSCIDFQNGDEVSNINDDAGKLRSYLQYSYKNGGKFVLLAGNDSIVPVRYGCAINFYGGQSVSKKGLIPTDAYYSDLSSNWNEDNDEFYGENYIDKIDFFPELFVGRLLCSTSEEVGNFTEKLIRYERNPGNGDYSYLSKAFITQSDQMQSLYQGDNFSRELSLGFGIKTIFSEIPSFDAIAPTFPTGTDCISEMNKHYGLLSWFGHGNPGGVCAKTREDNNGEHYGIIANSNRNSGHIDEKGNNGLDRLLNKDYPSIAISPSCSLSPFDIIPDYDFRLNMATSFTVGGLYGGPAFIGNTRNAYIDSANDLVVAVVRNIIHKSMKIGPAVAFAKTQTKDYPDKLKQNLVGCPELDMWTGVPQQFGKIDIVRGDRQITLKNADLSGCNIAYFDYNKGTRNIMVADSTVCVIDNADPNSSLVVYKHNYIPYFPSMELQNGVFNGPKYIFSESMSIGGKVNSTRSYGDFLFQKGVAVFDTEHDVKICEGTTFDNESDVTFKAKEVIIMGGKIKRGATVTVVAPSVKVIKNFDIEKGGVLNILTKQ